jgi:hypothetical protein
VATFLALLALALVPGVTQAHNHNLDRLNEALYGKVLDLSHNHGKDCRLYSPILDKWRDLYVYLPPNHTAEMECNLIVWIHGAFGDEQAAFFLSRIEVLDRLIASGRCGPTIVLVPDATLSGHSNPLAQHTFMMNGRAGCFEDHLLKELIPYIRGRFHIRPERRAHAICGVSAGGFAALSIGMRHRHQFGPIAALAPPANFRYDNCKKRYFADFKPAEFRWREEFRPREVVGTFLNGLIRLREGPFVTPIFGPKEVLIDNIKRVNPADLLMTEHFHPGELEIYIRYPKKDNFNFDAQIESFEWLAQSKGIKVAMQCDQEGRHVVSYFQDAMPSVWRWLAERLPNPLLDGNVEWDERGIAIRRDQGIKK